MSEPMLEYCQYLTLRNKLQSNVNQNSKLVNNVSMFIHLNHIDLVQPVAWHLVTSARDISLDLQMPQHLTVLGHLQTQCWLKSWIFPRFAGYQWFHITFINRMTSFKMADEIMWNLAARRLWINDYSSIVPVLVEVPQIAKFMGPTWGPPGSCRPQMGLMWASWTLLSGFVSIEIIRSALEDVMRATLLIHRGICDFYNQSITNTLTHVSGTDTANLLINYYHTGKCSCLFIHLLVWNMCLL